MPIIEKIVPAPELVGTKGYPRHYEAYGLPPPTKTIQVLVDDDGNEIIEGPDTGEPIFTLPEYAADKRWRVENGGIYFHGIHIATDDRSKTMIMGARIKSNIDPNYTVGWKGADGTFFTITAAQIIAISDAVLAHVDSCFATEAEIISAINSGEITTTEQIDNWRWPGQG